MLGEKSTSRNLRKRKEISYHNLIDITWRKLTKHHVLFDRPLFIEKIQIIFVNCEEVTNKGSHQAFK